MHFNKKKNNHVRKFISLSFFDFEKKLELYSLSYHTESKIKKKQDKKLTNFRILQILHGYFVSQIVLLI